MKNVKAVLLVALVAIVGMALAIPMQGCVTGKNAPTMTTTTETTDPVTGVVTRVTVTKADTDAIKALNDAVIAEVQAFATGAQGTATTIANIYAQIDASKQATSAQKETAKQAAQAGKLDALVEVASQVTGKAIVLPKSAAAR